jgi:myo-inositol 2-dehydrogenase / D-chiro-inositol 1-dehydrogenase
MAESANSRDLSRRDFVRSSAAIGAGVAGLGLARSAHAAGSDVIRIGVVGCGGRGTGAAANAMDADPGVRLVAMSDLFADRVRGRRNALKAQKAEQVQVDDEHCFDGMDGYKQVIDAVDVVLIACAAKFHPMYLKAGIEAGKHVFVEKPHAIDPLGIKVVNEATELAKRKNLGILSGLQSRFHPAIRETIQRVQDGQIGTITSIEENFIRGPYGATSRPTGMRELEIQYGNQYRFSWLCGDDVTQSLVHNLDRATWAMLETPPVKCHGLGGRSSSQNLLGDVFDHHSVVYHYANGARLYAFCRTTIGCYNENSSMIVGTKGTAFPLAGRITGENAWSFSGAVGQSVRCRASGLPQVDPGRPTAELRRNHGPQHLGRYHGPTLLLQRPRTDVGTREPIRLLPSAKARGMHLGHGPAHRTRRTGRLPGLRHPRHEHQRLTLASAQPVEGRTAPWSCTSPRSGCEKAGPGYRN